MKWWQLRTTEYAIGLYALVIPRVLLSAIFVLFAVHIDGGPLPNRPASYIDDFLFWDIPAYFSALFILCWIFFAVCVVSALAERSYGRVKFVVVFGTLSTLLYLSHKTTLALMTVMTHPSL